MRVFEREHYKLNEYINEKYLMEIYNKLRTTKTQQSDNYETLYIKAKEEAKKGNVCTIYELKYEFIP